MVKQTDEVLNLLSARDSFARRRFDEKKELIELRHDLASKLITQRDEFARNRHSERLEVFKSRLFPRK